MNHPMEYLHQTGFGIGILGVLVIVFGVACGRMRFVRSEIRAARGTDGAARRPYPLPAMIATVLLISLGAYLACGLLFAIPFVLVGVKKIDPHAAHGSWGFRLLVIPGAMAFWPLLLRRWASGVHQ